MPGVCGARGPFGIGIPMSWRQTFGRVMSVWGAGQVPLGRREIPIDARRRQARGLVPLAPGAALVAGRQRKRLVAMTRPRRVDDTPRGEGVGHKLRRVRLWSRILRSDGSVL